MSLAWSFGARGFLSGSQPKIEICRFRSPLYGSGGFFALLVAMRRAACYDRILNATPVFAEEAARLLREEDMENHGE